MSLVLVVAGLSISRMTTASRTYSRSSRERKERTERIHLVSSVVSYDCRCQRISNDGLRIGFLNTKALRIVQF